LQEVERRAFPRQEGAGVTVQPAHDLPARYPRAFLDPPADFYRRVEPTEAGIKPCAAAQHGILTRHDLRADGGRPGRERGRDIAAAHILGQSRCNVAVDFGCKVH